MYLSGDEAAALVRCLDGLSERAIVRLSRTDSLSNTLPWDDTVGWLRVQVVDGDYVADDVIGETGSISGATSDAALARSRRQVLDNEPIYAEDTP